MSEADLPILGTEPISVEFANTLYGTQDFLGTRTQAREWYAAAGLPQIRDTAAARLLRNGIHGLYAAAVTGDAPPQSAIAAVNRAAAASPSYLQLVWLPHANLTATNHQTATGDATILGGLATEAISLLTGGKGEFLRRCEGPECGLLFLQHHTRRRFCHESCAHRDRQARYYRRHTRSTR